MFHEMYLKHPVFIIYKKANACTYIAFTLPILFSTAGVYDVYHGNILLRVTRCQR